MINKGFYKKYLNINTDEELCQRICDSLIDTNHTYDFFVNWQKVIKNRDIFKYELSLLSSLKMGNSPKKDLSELIKRYPEVVKVFPILIACRDGLIQVLDKIKPCIKYKVFNFSKQNFTNSEIEEITLFVEKTGLLKELCSMDSPLDYLLGVEVGLDSNARKNRSGFFLEKMVTEKINEIINEDPSIQLFQQKKFKYIKANLGINIPNDLKEKIADNLLIKDNKGLNIEVNFFGGTGSKPSEIVPSYINRSQVLASAGWKFVWLTDGQGWRSMNNPLKVGAEYIQYIINVDMLRSGVLEKIIQQ
jgi:type II restriction enzyme